MLARTRQPALGDDEDAETRLAEVKEKVAYKLSLLGDVGITKPKQVLECMEDVTFKKVGGQQLTCKCISVALSSRALAQPVLLII